MVHVEPERKPIAVHTYNTSYGFTIIEEFADGVVTGRQIQNNRGGHATVEFVMNNYPLWKAISLDGDVEYLRTVITQEGFADIDWQERDHPIYRGQTPLIAATVAGRLDMVTLLLEKGANPNLYDDSHLTAAHYAIEGTLDEIFEVLVKNPKTDINQIIDGTDPLLHTLMVQGNKELAQMVVDRGADINLHTEDVPTPLCFALADGGNADCARWLIGLGADVKIAFDGITPMSFAAASGLVDVMELLLEKGAVMTLEESHTTTPLHSSASNNRIEAVKFVVNKGIDVNMVDNKGDTALTKGAKYPDVVDFLMAKGARVETDKAVEYIFRAAQGGSLKLLKLFFETYNMDVHTRSGAGQTVLFEAAAIDAYDSPNKAAHVEYLIEKGVDVNAVETTGQGVSALLIAVEKGKIENVTAMLKAGANPNMQDNDGYTPLHMACGNGMADMADLLVKAGADMNIKSNSGETPSDLGKPNIGVYKIA